MNIGTDIHDKTKMYPFTTWIDGMEWVEQNHQAVKLYGFVVDAITANAVMLVYNSLNDEKQDFVKNEKNTADGMLSFIEFAWKCVK